MANIEGETKDTYSGTDSRFCSLFTLYLSPLPHPPPISSKLRDSYRDQFHLSEEKQIRKTEDAFGEKVLSA